MHPQLTLDDFPFYKTFDDLYVMCVDLPWSVALTDADLLHLVHKSPHLTELVINIEHGWTPNDVCNGITLNGPAELLRSCPSLKIMKLAIDTQTFIEIPQGLDVGFPPNMVLDFLDSRRSFQDWLRCSKLSM